LGSISINLAKEKAFNWKGTHGYNVFYFVKTLTDQGYCSSFNLLQASDIFNNDELDPNFVNSLEMSDDHNLNRSAKYWDPERGYLLEATLKTYPLRSMEANVNLGFQLKLSMHKEEMDLQCENGTQGYKILFHYPTHWPQFTRSFIQISHNTRYKMVIKPQITTTAPGLERYSFRKYLIFFKFIFELP
jgi:hypothetical protein